MNRSQFNEALEKLERAPAKKQVLQLVLAGHTDPEIALKTGTKPGTVRKQISNIYQSFGIKGEYKGDRRPRRDELVAQFRKYKSEWVSDFPSAVKNEVLIAQTAEVAEQEGVIAKLHPESREAVNASVRELSPEQAVLDQSQPSYPLQEKKENALEASHTIGAISFLEYFSKSIDQLQSKALDVRIGAISTLGTLAEYSQPAEHWRIMEYLAAFIRANAPRKEEEQGEEERSPKISEDIQAALTVIGRRDSHKDLGNQRLDLSETDLRGTNLNGANLQGVNLNGANLREVNLIAANLEGATLKRANLEGAIMHKANLRRANLEEATLRGADLDMTDLQEADLWSTNLQRTRLRRANLQRAKLLRANLQGAFLSDIDWQGAALPGVNLQGADLRGAKNLAPGELEDTDGDSKAASSLPETVKAPEHWIYPK
jgi:hypothetical protein